MTTAEGHSGRASILILPVLKGSALILSLEALSTGGYPYLQASRALFRRTLLMWKGKPKEGIQVHDAFAVAFTKPGLGNSTWEKHA